VKVLKFHPLMLDQIRLGNKTATRRPMDGNDHYATWKPGDVALVLHPNGMIAERLEITRVSGQSLNDMTEREAKAEGFTEERCGGGWRGDSALTQFYQFWDRIYGEGSHKANPHIYVIEFKRLEAGA